MGSNTETLEAPPDIQLPKVTAQRLLLVQRSDFGWTKKLKSCEPTVGWIDCFDRVSAGASWERLTSEQRFSEI